MLFVTVLACRDCTLGRVLSARGQCGLLDELFPVNVDHANSSHVTHFQPWFRFIGMLGLSCVPLKADRCPVAGGLQER